MIIGNLWGLLGLLAIPAILAIHLFRRSFKEHPVTGLWLYGAGMQVATSGRRRERIVNRRSLWLELLAALVATWFLADVHFSDRQQARHLVLVLDTRIRLQAIDRQGQSTHARLQEELRSLCAALARDDRVTLVTSGSPPGILIGPAVRPREAIAALERWQPDQTWHDLRPAIALASDVGSSQATGEGKRKASIVLASDALPGGLAEDAVALRGLGLVLRGAKVANSGLVDARWFAADGEQGERLTLRLGAFGADVQRQLVISGAAPGDILKQTIRLPANSVQAMRVVLPSDFSGEQVQVQLLGKDALAFDDSCLLLRPDARRIRVAVDLPEDLRPPIDRVIDAIPLAEAVERGERHELLITTDTETTPSDGVWHLVLTPGESEAVLGPFLARRGDSVLGDLDFTGVVWSGGVDRSAVAPPDVLLAGGETVLMARSGDARERIITLFCDLKKSTVVRHTAWPALFANLIEARRQALPGPRHRNLLVGQPSVVMLPRGWQRISVQQPGSESQAVEMRHDGQGEVLVPGLTRPGLHAIARITNDGEAEDWTQINALPFDSRLSDCRVAREVRRPPETTGPSEVHRQRGVVEHLLPLLLLAVVALGGWHSDTREERQLTGPVDDQGGPSHA